jgi:hypothetical protein
MICQRFIVARQYLDSRSSIAIASTNLALNGKMHHGPEKPLFPNRSQKSVKASGAPLFWSRIRISTAARFLGVSLKPVKDAPTGNAEVGEQR